MAFPWTAFIKPRTIMALAFVSLLISGAGRLALAQDDERSYSLPEVIGLAIEHNPRPAGAIGTIDIQEGLVVQAGAYPNPRVHAPP